MDSTNNSFAIPVTEDESVVTSAGGDPTINLNESSINGGLYSGVDGGVYQSAARFYLKFELPEYVDNTEITSATLTGFYYDDFDADDDGIHNVYFVASDSWSESSVTFSNQPGQAFGIPEASFDAAEATPGHFVSLDLTSIANQEYKGDGTLSLLVHADGESVSSENRNFEYFVEKEYDSSKAFQLEVTMAGDKSVPEKTLDAAEDNPMPNKTLRYEAEDLDLVGYQVESVRNSGASGGQQLSLKNTGFDIGSAIGEFKGQAGTYQVEVGYYDENDGISGVTVVVAEEVASFQFDQDLPSNYAQSASHTTRLVHSAVELEPGDFFSLSGHMDNDEYVRFDYIDFIPVDGASLAAEAQMSAGLF